MTSTATAEPITPEKEWFPLSLEQLVQAFAAAGVDREVYHNSEGELERIVWTKPYDHLFVLAPLGRIDMEAIRRVECRSFMGQHENPPHIATIIRAVGDEPLDGYFTRVLIRAGGKEFRYPVDADPRRTGVQDRIIASHGPDRWTDTWRQLYLGEKHLLFSDEVTRG